MDDHPQATALLFPCSLSQGFMEAGMKISVFHSFLFVLFLAVRCITRGGSIAYTGLSQRQRCLVQSETQLSCMAADGDFLYGLRR
jgi:hypothetical protein